MFFPYIYEITLVYAVKLLWIVVATSFIFTSNKYIYLTQLSLSIRRNDIKFSVQRLLYKFYVYIRYIFIVHAYNIIFFSSLFVLTIAMITYQLIYAFQCVHSHTHIGIYYIIYFNKNYFPFSTPLLRVCVRVTCSMRARNYAVPPSHKKYIYDEFHCTV